MPVVYSTDKGRHPKPGKDKADRDEDIAGDGVVSLQRQVKGRNGKPVVLVSGLPGTAAEAVELPRLLPIAAQQLDILDRQVKL